MEHSCSLGSPEILLEDWLTESQDPKVSFYVFITHLPPGFQVACVAMKRPKLGFKPEVDPISGQETVSLRIDSSEGVSVHQ